MNSRDAETLPKPLLPLLGLCKLWRLRLLSPADVTYSLHCSVSWFNQLPYYVEDLKDNPKKGTTMKTIGKCKACN